MKRLINIRKNLSGHRTYFLTFLITYFLGGVISTLVCFIKSQIYDFDVYDIIQVITGFFMASTYTFLLSSNFSRMNEDTGIKAFWPLIALIYSIVYIVFYIVFELLSNNWVVIILSWVFTVLAVYLDVLAYLEAIEIKKDIENENCGNSQFSGNKN